MTQLGLEDDRTKVGKYALTLQLWLAMNNLNPRGDPNPIIGTWDLSHSGGRLEFTHDTFTWWHHNNQPDSHARHGTYTILPGIRLHQGIILNHGKPDTACYSIILHQQTLHHNSTNTPAQRLDILSIEQLGSPHHLDLFDHRTTNHYHATRPTAPVEAGTQ